MEQKKCPNILGLYTELYGTNLEKSNFCFFIFNYRLMVVLFKSNWLNCIVSKIRYIQAVTELLKLIFDFPYFITFAFFYAYNLTSTAITKKKKKVCKCLIITDKKLQRKFSLINICKSLKKKRKHIYVNCVIIIKILIYLCKCISKH